MYLNAECNGIHPKTLNVKRPCSFKDTSVMNRESTNESTSITACFQKTFASADDGVAQCYC